MEESTSAVAPQVLIYDLLLVLRLPSNHIDNMVNKPGYATHDMFSRMYALDFGVIFSTSFNSLIPLYFMSIHACW